MPRISFKRGGPLATVIAGTLLFSVFLSRPPAYAANEVVERVIQAGAFHKWENALALSEDIQKSGKKAFIMEKTLNGKVFYAVLESKESIKPPSKPQTAKEQGYEQVGAFLSRENAESLILSLRHQGAITFHCMNKKDGNIYYKVYRKTGVVVSSPCTLVPVTGQAPTAIQESNASVSASGVMPAGAIPVPLTPMADSDAGSPTEKGISNAPDGNWEPWTQEALEPRPDIEVIEMEDEESQVIEPEGRFIVNTASDDKEEMDVASASIGTTGTLPEDMTAGPDIEGATEPALQADGEIDQPEDMEQSMGQGSYGALPQTGPLPERPPIAQGSGEIILDISPIRPIDDSIHFYIKPKAVVFTDRNQFGTWYARFNELGGGMVTGQSNKWYVVRFREGVTGYVQKADSIEYTLPYDDEDRYK